jgi:hypothetical protein
VTRPGVGPSFFRLRRPGPFERWIGPKSLSKPQPQRKVPSRTFIAHRAQHRHDRRKARLTPLLSSSSPPPPLLTSRFSIPPLSPRPSAQPLPPAALLRAVVGSSTWFLLHVASAAAPADFCIVTRAHLDHLRAARGPQESSGTTTKRPRRRFDRVDGFRMCVAK